MQPLYNLTSLSQVPDVNGVRPEEGFNWFKYSIVGPDKHSPITCYKQAASEEEVKKDIGKKISELNNTDIGAACRWAIYDI